MAQDGNPTESFPRLPDHPHCGRCSLSLRNWRPGFNPLPILWTYWPLISHLYRSRKDMVHNVQRSRHPNAPPGVSIGATIGTIALCRRTGRSLWHGRSFSRSTASIRGQSTIRKLWSCREQSRHAPGWRWVRGSSLSTAVRAIFSTQILPTAIPNDEPRVDYHVDGGVGQLNISQGSHSVHFGRSQNDWNLHFNNGHPAGVESGYGGGEGESAFSRRSSHAVGSEYRSGAMDGRLHRRPQN